MSPGVKDRHRQSGTAVGRLDFLSATNSLCLRHTGLLLHVHILTFPLTSWFIFVANLEWVVRDSGVLELSFCSEANHYETVLIN